MKWISVKKSPMPKKGGVFLSLWKGAISLTEYDSDEDAFWIGFLPAQYEGFWKVPKERENKFTHWCPLELPQDY